MGATASLPGNSKGKPMSNYTPIDRVIAKAMRAKIEDPRKWRERLYCAVALREIMGWHNSGRVRHGGIWYVVRTMGQWQEDCDLSRRAIERAFSLLSEHGYIERTRLVFMGRPAVGVRLTSDARIALNNIYADNGSTYRLGE